MKLIHGVTAVLIATAVAACDNGVASGGGEGGERREFADGGTFTSTLTADPGNLNPLKVVQQSTNTIRAFAYDSLVYVAPDGEVVPRIASSWEATPTSVTFTLNEGVTCTDGTEVTPSVAAQTFEWIKDPDNGSTLLGGEMPNMDFGIEADDEAGTLTLTVPEPYGFLLEGAGGIPIVCPKGLANPKSIAQATDGTGPFVLSEYVADDHLTMVAREGYSWGPDGVSSDEPGFPAKVVFRIIQDPTTAVNLFLAGELTDVTPTGAQKARLEGRDAFTLESPSGPTELFFNQRPGSPGAEVEVRRALTAALDLDELTQVITEGEGERADSLAVLRPRPCTANTVEGHLPEHDPEEAGRLLDEAGWTMGADGIRTRDGEPLAVTLRHLSGDSPLEAAMELVARSWGELGVDVTTRGQGTNAYLEALFGGGDWEAAVLGAQIAYPSEFMPFAAGPLPPEGQNFAAIDNPDYTALAEEASGTSTQDGACEIWGRAEQALFDNVDVVPVANTVITTYSDHAEFKEGITSWIEPTSIRLYAK